MRKSILLVFLLSALSVSAQNKKDSIVIHRMELFHQMIVEQPGNSTMDNYINDSLTYGHSNGWIENHKQFLDDMNSKFIIYHSFKEDSITIARVGNTACIRFIADIDATLKGKRATFHLKVLEVWVGKGKHWELLSRQAVKG